MQLPAMPTWLTHDNATVQWSITLLTGTNVLPLTQTIVYNG